MVSSPVSHARFDQCSSKAASSNELDAEPDKDHQDPSNEPSGVLLKTGRLFLRNLAYAVTTDDLKTLFAPFGELSEVGTALWPLFTRLILREIQTLNW